VSALSAGGSNDVTSVCLVLWQLRISRRPGRLWDPAFNRDPAFIRTQTSKPRRLLDPAIVQDLAFNRSFTVVGCPVCW